MPGTVRAESTTDNNKSPGSAGNRKVASKDPDFAIQGEYVGVSEAGEIYGLQIVATGREDHGELLGTLFEGTCPSPKECGLPGLGQFQNTNIVCHFAGGWLDNKEVYLGDGEGPFHISVQGAKAELFDATQRSGRVVEMRKLDRKGQTLGAKPPAGAVVLFDGTSSESWLNGTVEDGLLIGDDLRSKKLFGDYRIHLEFRTPYVPSERAYELMDLASESQPGRAKLLKSNGGIWHHGRHHVLIRDSFGYYHRRECDGDVTDTGAIDGVAEPKLNACLPPLVWQTYDADFRAPRLNDDGKVSEPARITVRINGSLVHQERELKSLDYDALKRSGRVALGPFYLQSNHPIAYANIWVVNEDSTGR
jgi:hypothetical protein